MTSAVAIQFTYPALFARKQIEFNGMTRRLVEVEQTLRESLEATKDLNQTVSAKTRDADLAKKSDLFIVDTHERVYAYFEPLAAAYFMRLSLPLDSALQVPCGIWKRVRGISISLDIDALFVLRQGVY